MQPSVEHRRSEVFRHNRAERSDQELISKFSSGDKTAWSELQTRYENRLRRYVHNFLYKDEDVDEVVNKAFFKASLHLGEFRSGAPFFNWLIHIARNLAKDQLRHNSLRDMVVPVEDIEVAGGKTEDTPETRFLRDETRHRINEALLQLTDTLREAYLLTEVRGLSDKAAAEVLGIKEPNVRMRVFRAKQKLRELLSDLEELEAA